MILRYDFGTPFATGACVLELPPEKGDPLFFSVERDRRQVTLSLSLGREDMLFGLGEQVGPVNRRGRRYQSWNSDEFNHSEDRQSLYGSHNFLIVFRKEKPFALYLDDPGRVKWDLGWTRRDRMVLTSENGDFSLYLLLPGDGEKACLDLCAQFRKLIGQSYIPPRWALGYIQSRWGYASAEDARAVAAGHRVRQIPLDGICMDIDYMDGFRDFTWNRQAIPDLEGLCGELKREGVRLIPIIDAGVKKDEGYAVWREGRDRGYFCEKADGSPFEAAVWPGLSCFPDFFRPEVRAWFGEKYGALLDRGAEGFWNDMNEPALFYSPEGLAEAFRTMEALKGSLDRHDASFELQGTFDRVKNAMADYRRFYHRTERGNVSHDRVHNLYGGFMTRAAAEAFEKMAPDRRILLFSRSSFIGAHRWGGVWMGDNFSWWSHLKLHLRMLPSLNMAGFIYCGADVGGFGADTDEELMIRWLQLGAFTPLFRNHSALNTRFQEIWRFPAWETMREAVRVRYALLPWLYSEMMQAILGGTLLFRPLCFDWPADPTAREIEDQMMLGRDCMIAPVTEPHVRGRNVYLPGDMLCIRFRTWEDRDQIPLRAGWHYLEAAENEFFLFVRRGAFIALACPAEQSEHVRTGLLYLAGWTDGEEAVLPFYEDDGIKPHPVLRDGLDEIRLSGGGARDGRGRTLDLSGLC